jgi:acetoin utilization protein AcuB
MSLKPVTVPPTASVIEAAQLLRANKVGALLVVEEEELLGIITKSDLLDAFIEQANIGGASTTSATTTAPRS